MADNNEELGGSDHDRVGRGDRTATRDSSFYKDARQRETEIELRQRIIELENEMAVIFHLGGL